MRKRKRIFSGATCAALLATLILAAPRNREPSYGGHPLSFWVILLANSVPTDDNYHQATNAVSHIGPQALPFLLQWVRIHFDTWRSRTGDAIKKLPPHNLTDLIAYRITFTRREDLCFGTMEAFRALGSAAIPAVPELCRLVDDQADIETASMAVQALAAVGTNGLPTILATAGDPYNLSRFCALSALRNMPDLEKVASLVVPTLIECLHDNCCPEFPAAAAEALGYLKHAPELSIPALVSALRSQMPAVREQAAKSLGDFGLQAANAIPALTSTMADPNARVSSEAARSLHGIAPNQFTNAPPLPPR